MPVVGVWQAKVSASSKICFSVRKSMVGGPASEQRSVSECEALEAVLSNSTAFVSIRQISGAFDEWGLRRICEDDH